LDGLLLIANPIMTPAIAIPAAIKIASSGIEGDMVVV
jgi:hypothetical protein